VNPRLQQFEANVQTRLREVGPAAKPLDPRLAEFEAKQIAVDYQNQRADRMLVRSRTAVLLFWFFGGPVMGLLIYAAVHLISYFYR
jgi:hypothetical protein